MSSHRVRARSPHGEPRPSSRLAGDACLSHVKDAAQTPGGHTPVVAFPASEAEVALILREAPATLPVGAQSSLTGGATPFGEWVLSLARMDRLGPVHDLRVEVEAGVPLLALEVELHDRGLFYPPVPTFRGAFVGGTASTNAAGAATFKYGSTRDWVDALTVVLASGDVLDLERGECRAHPDGHFEVELPSGEVRRVPVPTYTMPKVPKRSAGYHAEPRMDLVDLFVGSEGTLGVITRLRLRLIREPRSVLGFMTFPRESSALEAASRLRHASKTTWAARDPSGIDVASIEFLDSRCLELLREDQKDVENGIPLPEGLGAALLFDLELGPDPGPLGGSEGPLDRLAGLLEDLGALDSLRMAAPEERRRSESMKALREAVPVAVNHRIAALQRSHPGVQKTAADMIVPFERLSEAIAVYREGFRRRGLDHALWGHVSDGNIHANVIPRFEADVRAGEEAILEFGDAIVRLGGCPLSEHGVGRSRVKQELLRRLYGDAGIREMRRVKAALDPSLKLSPGVLFPKEEGRHPTGMSR
jgi:D-lactate dehydrogenase (cytochrome)